MAVTRTVGGATSGYCAIGSLSNATTPRITTTTDSTVAKTGRSTKKRDSTGDLSRSGRTGADRVRRNLGTLRRGGRGALSGSWSRGCRHGCLSWIDNDTRPNALQSVDDYPVALLE